MSMDHLKQDEKNTLKVKLDNFKLKYFVNSIIYTPNITNYIKNGFSKVDNRQLYVMTCKECESQRAKKWRKENTDYKIEAL